MTIRNDPETRDAIVMGLICIIWMDEYDALYEGLRKIYGEDDFDIDTWIQENAEALTEISNQGMALMEMRLVPLLSKDTEK